MLIELKDVCYTYGVGTVYEVNALDHVNLSIDEGEFIGVIGHTGSGKSTLIQHLNGLIKPTSGEVLFEGKNIWDNGYDLRSLRTHVGLVFQYPENQLFETDVLKDVMFGPKNEGLSQEECEERAKRALKEVGIAEELYTASPFELSGGQKRRVAVAGVLAMDPEVLILDEPTAGLDPAGRDEILNRIKYLRDTRGITVILVSHSMEDVARYATRLLVVNDGKIAFEGSYESGGKDGSWCVWYKNGRVAIEGFYKSHVKDGHWQVYHENGQLAFEGSYEKGKPKGIWKEWLKNGQLKREFDYDAVKRNFGNERFANNQSKTAKHQIENNQVVMPLNVVNEEFYRNEKKIRPRPMRKKIMSNKPMGSKERRTKDKLMNVLPWNFYPSTLFKLEE